MQNEPTKTTMCKGLNISHLYGTQWRIKDFIEVGCANILFHNIFAKKLHENKRIWTEMGARFPSALLDPPLELVVSITHALT